MTGGLTVDQFDRLEKKLDAIEAHAGERHRTVMVKIETIWDRLSSMDKAVAVMQERSGLVERVGQDHEERLRALESQRWYLHGVTGAITLLGSWLIQHFFPTKQ